MRPLEGLTVLDLTRVLAGPFCGMTLADLGANVIKIEGPNGDDARGNGPFVKGESTYFMSLNRGKRSIVLNLKEKDNQAILKAMVKQADILVENFRPGTMEKFGLGYDVLKEVNPKLIYCAISGFGQTGPYKYRAAYDIIVQGMSGIMSVTGPNGGPPTRVGSSIGDVTAGLFGTIGVLAALENRHKTGKGEYIDVGMLDCLVSVLENAIVRYYANGVSPIPIGSRHPVVTPFDVFKTKDGSVIIAIQNNSLWERFCNVVNAQQLINDARFNTNALRTENEAELKEIIEELFAGRSTSKWMAIMVKAGIPCGPINKIEDMVNDPQIVAREMIVDVKGHKTVGSFKMPGIPIKYKSSPCTLDKPAPVLGEHTEEILQEFGLLAKYEKSSG